MSPPTSEPQIQAPTLTSQPLSRSFLTLVPIALISCGGGGGDGVTGSVLIDGSSTVFPVAEAVAEEFQILHPQARITVGLSGTGGGFQRFCAGETDLTNASRPITEDERAACEAAGIEFTELRVGWDGLSLIVHPENEFVSCLTVEELRRIWEPGSSVTTWRDVRSEWPDEPIRLYGPGTDSGTFDYFTETINGENRNLLKLLAVDGGEGCVTPSDETIEDQSYAPLARPLYMYVRNSELERPAVLSFVEFMLEEASVLVPSTGYHALSEAEYAEQLREIRQAAGQAG